MPHAYRLRPPTAWLLLALVLLLAPVGLYLATYFGATPALAWYFRIPAHGSSPFTLPHPTVVLIARVAFLLGVAIDLRALVDS